MGVSSAEISIILVNYNTSHLLKECFDALNNALEGVKAQIIVVDNASADDSVTVLKRDYPYVQLIENIKNVGFGRANNQVLTFVDSPYVLLLNTDAFVEANTIRITLDYMKTNLDIGVLGVRLIGRDGMLQPSCRYFPTPWNTFLIRTGLSGIFRNAQLVDDMAWDHNNVRECDWVPGCYYLIRKAVIDQVGLFDPRYFLYSEEVDHCFSVKNAGWKVVYFPYTSVVHIGGESAKSIGEISVSGRQITALQVESELLYFRKNHGISGVVQHLILGSLAALIQMLKDILKGRGWSFIHISTKNTLLLWRMFFRTKFAAIATR